MQRVALMLLVAGLLLGCGGAPVDVRTPDVTGRPATDMETPAASHAVPTMALTATPIPVPSSLDVTPVAGEPTPQAVAAPAAYITVTVASGDTLLGLAVAYDVPMAAIQLQNDMGSSTLVQLGQSLVIPPKSAWEGASLFWTVHEVVEGETLSEIAQAYGLTVADLQGTNGLADADLLGVGQALVLPLTDFVTPVAGALVAAPTAVPPTAAVVEAADATPASPVETAADAEPTATSAPQIAAAPPPADVADWPRETVRIMNEVRAAHGLPPLTYNETLAQAAQGQANDCAARGSCSHTGSDGSTIKDRILGAGYREASYAECWAVRPTPQGAIDIWMDEVPPNDPHRRTLLTTWLSEIGIGVAQTTNGYYYFIADFGRPLQ